MDGKGVVMAKAAAKKKVVETVPVAPPRPRPTIPVQAIVKWVSEARPDKDIGVGMSFYIVRDGEIRATDGKLTASYPWPNDDLFLVSGNEFEKVLGRMGEDVEIIYNEEGVTYNDIKEGKKEVKVTVRSDRFTAKIATLSPDMWGYHGVEDAAWSPVPDNFIPVLKSLRAFISDNPAQAWAGCVAIESGNMYATNNIALAGAACDVGEVQTLLPANAIDFVLRRIEGLQSWFCNHNYIAFKWESGAWMRVQRVEGKFPERAAGMVREAYDIEPTQEITDEFREAFADVAGLAEDTIRVYADRLESKYKKSVIVAACECEVPADGEQWDAATQKNKPVAGGVSIWGAAFLAPVISQATHWSPGLWPKPAPFRGDNVAGFIVGRKAE